MSERKVNLWFHYFLFLGYLALIGWTFLYTIQKELNWLWYALLALYGVYFLRKELHDYIADYAEATEIVEKKATRIYRKIRRKLNGK